MHSFYLLKRRYVILYAFVLLCCICTCMLICTCMCSPTYLLSSSKDMLNLYFLSEVRTYYHAVPCLVHISVKTMSYTYYTQSLAHGVLLHCILTVHTYIWMNVYNILAGSLNRLSSTPTRSSIMPHLSTTVSCPTSRVATGNPYMTSSGYLHK